MIKKAIYFLGIIAIVVVVFILGYNFQDYSMEESNSNISTETIIVTNISEESIITKKIDQLTLNSDDLEAGYSLNRRFSGFEKRENYEYFVKTFNKEGADIGAQRILTVSTYKFNSSEDAESMLNSMNLEFNKLGFSVVRYASSDGKNAIFKRDYLADFEPFENYVLLSLYQNVIIIFDLTAPLHSSNYEELEYYSRQFSDDLSSPERIVDVSISSYLQPRVQIMTSIWLISEESGNDGSISKNKQQILLSLCINNTGDNGVNLSSSNWFLTDNLGNYYSAESKLSGKDYLKSSEISCRTEYVFSVINLAKNKNLKSFILHLQNADESLIGVLNISTMNLSREANFIQERTAPAGF